MQRSAILMAVSRGKQGADVPKIVVGRLVHDRNQQATCKELRELLVRDASALDALQ